MNSLMVEISLESCLLFYYVPITNSRLNAELQSARSSRSTPGHHRLRPIVRSRERRAMVERWGALSGTGEVPEELIDQVE